MKVQWRFAVTSALLVTLTVGCAGVQRCMDKDWGTGTLAGAGVGAIAGGIAAGAASNNTGAFDIGDDNEDKALAIGTGVIAGSAIGALIGHCLWDRAPLPSPVPPPPAPAPTPAPVKQKIVLRGVNFDFDKATIRPDAAPILDEAARVLSENPDVNVSVAGHTDAVGTDEYNQGVSADRLSTKGFGESEPVATNENADGRAQNRRVELKTLE
jgi:outer membrane protein OmpA-like peptidoglycan-associated protein